MNSSRPLELATLAGGCFWCLDAVYRDLKGVVRVEAGYSGGRVANPSYKSVCSGETGHAEVVRIEFDPYEASYRDLLRVFFTVHDPTTLNRQGADVGTQYRSAIFTHSGEQEVAAREVIAELSAEGLWRDPIVTAIEPLRDYFPAESYHQDYFALNPNQPYCRAVVAPKVAKFRKRFLEQLKAGV